MVLLEAQQPHRRHHQQHKQKQRGQQAHQQQQQQQEAPGMSAAICAFLWPRQVMLH
jgi:hypothetical protein